MGGPAEFDLFSVPITGGPSTLLFDAGPPHVAHALAISPDSARVIYIADGNTNGVLEIYSVPIGGGAIVQLNSSMAAPRRYFAL